MNRHALLGAGFIVLAMLFWGGNATIGRFAMTTELPPIGVNFWRWTVAFAILAAAHRGTRCGASARCSGATGSTASVWAFPG